MTPSLGAAAYCWSSIEALLQVHLQPSRTDHVNTCWVQSNHCFVLHLQALVYKQCESISTCMSTACTAVSASCFAHVLLQCMHRSIMCCMQEQGQHTVCSVHDKAEIQAEVAAHVLWRPRRGALYAALLHTHWSELLLSECVSHTQRKKGQLRQKFLRRQKCRLPINKSDVLCICTGTESVW